MKKWVRFGSAALLMFAFSACGSLDDLTDLEVVNQNNPDRERALSEAADIESLVSSGYFIYHEVYWSPSSPLSIIGEEGSLSWGNQGAQQLGTEPRVAWPNSPSWRYREVNEQPWYDNYEALSSVYDGLKAMEAQPELCGTADDQIDCDRAHAFAKFIQGLGHAFLGLMFDQGFIFDETVDLATDDLEMVNYPNLIAAAETYFTAAATEANGAAWSLPSSWIRGNPVTAANFARFANSHLARTLYMSAREPAEYAALPWDEIRDLITEGINVAMSRDGGYGPERMGIFLDGDVNQDWWSNINYYANATTASSWHRADYKAIGYNETDGGYSAWLATPVADRNDFCLNTADERVIGAACDQDGLDFVYKGKSPFPASRGTYFYSMYMNGNYAEYANGDQSAPIPQMQLRAQQLIQAEAMARLGDVPGAADVVDVTRMGRGNLGPAERVDLNVLLPQLWYEFIIEDYYVCPGCAYFPRRGWEPLAPTGPTHHWGLVEGTPLHFPVPGKELEILQMPNYTFGGVGNEGGTLPPSASGARSGRSIPASAIYAFTGMETTAEKLDYIYQDSDAPSSGVLSLVRH